MDRKAGSTIHELVNHSGDPIERRFGNRREDRSASSAADEETRHRCQRHRGQWIGADDALPIHLFRQQTVNEPLLDRAFGPWIVHDRCVSDGGRHE